MCDISQYYNRQWLGSKRLAQTTKRYSIFKNIICSIKIKRKPVNAVCR